MSLSQINLDDIDLDLELIRSVPFRYLHKYRAVPLLINDVYAVIALENPADMLTIDALQRVLHEKIIKPLRATSQQIDRLLKKSKMLLDTESLVNQIRIDVNSDIKVKKDRRVICCYGVDRVDTEKFH